MFYRSLKDYDCNFVQLTCIIITSVIAVYCSVLHSELCTDHKNDSTNRHCRSRINLLTDDLTLSAPVHKFLTNESTISVPAPDESTILVPAPFLHPTLKHLFHTWRVYWDPLYTDLKNPKVKWNPVQLYLITPKVCIDPVFKDILPLKSPETLVVGCRDLITPKVSWDPGGACSKI